MISAHCKRILDDFEVRTKEICWSFREVRAVVMCFAWREMEEKHIPFREAVRSAWDWVRDKCHAAGAYI